MSIGISCISILTLSSATEDTDPDEEFQDQAIFSYILNSNTYPIPSCEESYREAFTCSSVSQGFPIPIVNEAVLSSVFTTGQENNFNQLCSNQRTNEIYKNFSDRAFACNFRCQKSYWNSKSTESDCASQNFDNLITGSLHDLNTKSCIDSYIRVTGNTYIPEDRKSSYLLFQIF